MSPIKLSDAELSAIMTACQPLDPAARDGFVRAVANALHGCAEVGPGSVHRAIVAAQREHFNPPDLTRSKDLSKYR